MTRPHRAQLGPGRELREANDDDDGGRATQCFVTYLIRRSWLRCMKYTGCTMDYSRMLEEVHSTGRVQCLVQ
jgi:hypothetical protein